MIRLAKEGRSMEKKVYTIPDEQDAEIARMKLETMGIGIDTLTEDQIRYRDDYSAGT